MQKQTKRNKKLSLTTQLVRVLVPTDLSDVAGGRVAVSQTGPTCRESQALTCDCL